MPVLRCPQCGRAYSYDRRKVGYGLICATPGCQTIIPVKSPVSRWLVACALGVCVALGVGYAFGHSAANKSVSAAAAPALVAASVPGPVLNTRKPHSHQSSLPPGLYVPTQAEAQQAGQEWARVRPQASQPTAAPVQKATAAPMFAVLLPTGTEVAPAQGAAGRGELTVVNGTGQDAVVKLAAAGRPDGPLVAFRTVYVQAGAAVHAG